MNRQEQVKKLSDAAMLVLEVSKTLNTKESTCGNCGLAKKVDWTEARAESELSGVVHKLSKIIDMLVAEERKQ